MSIHPRVLIVDDEAPLRRQVMVGLAQHGYEVDECEEGLSALSKIKAAESKQNPFGCVILDVRLPDIDGLKILSVIKSIYSELPVVVITGYGSEDTVNTVHSHGGSVYLDKPFEMDDLVTKIQHILPKPEAKPERKAAVKPHVLTSGLVFIRGKKGADLPEIYSKLYLADGVCYCDAVLGEWDIVLLVQAQNRKSLNQIVQNLVQALKEVETFEVHYCEKPVISRDLEEFIQDYEKVQAMTMADGFTMDGRNVRKPTSYAVLDVDPGKLSSLYMKLYFTDHVVHCDVTDDGLFTFMVVACLGCCSLAPAMMIDGQTYGRLTPQKIRRLIRQYRLDAEKKMALTVAKAVVAAAGRSSESGPPALSPRERAVLKGIFEGLANKQIAAELNISESSVKAVVQQLFEKTGVRTRGQLVRVALERRGQGWI